eukprot:PhF_6_TR25754/c0_g1_i1/m.36313
MKRIPRGSPSWTDDNAYEEEKMREFLRQREAGTLLSQRVAAKQLRHMQREQLTPLHPDGYIRFGDRVMLQSAETKGYLSVDIDDVVQEVPLRKIGVTTSAAPFPQKRNTWFIHRVEDVADPLWIDSSEGDLLHYGQKFRLQLHPELSPETYLHSELKTLTSYSKITRQQEVCVTDKQLKGAVWATVFGDEKFRFEMEGQPVKANAILMLKHSASNATLSSSKAVYPNDFGAEFEVCCSGTGPKNTSAGRDQNYFVMVTAPPEGTASE